ncbi:putative EXG1-exo-beta-1,3-glucanase, major isoform [Microstroma glucosiphilum]|uniref:Putative EXG1-exo-beta-1,3-glucanase, major isoform n=1 Tax=Pseudomicrostroma glucosiphilum TaxID=1684307 RepID=A0A316TYH9_9BASI|nr:putative EXG1-exo-beta-1,3-glucanase, major isoform [Pseudomicrostroma glucosiphilum]PWN18207.1 putative EXG1-exo-beta-1,3-glucanase, major isoform [Pseudomicrostroma glucosiphilum]
MLRLVSLTCLLSILLPLVSAAGPRALPFGHAPDAKRFNFGSTKVRGVNIGGWLVAEPFITPSLFQAGGDSRIVDEYTFGQYSKKACSLLASHWKTWITESDFKAISAAGLNTVRIPIGYWAFDSDYAPYCQGSQFSYLTKAVGWAQKYGLKVVIDLHGAPASQNGFDNSGHRRTSPGWFNVQSRADRAQAAISTMAKKFSTSAYGDTVSAIELLNEPLTTANIGGALEFTIDYYESAYSSVRYAQGKKSPTSQAVMIHDGFQDLSRWYNELQPPTYQNVVLDHHQYSIFTPTQVAWNQTTRLNDICTYRSKLANAQSHLWTIVGEWTSANTDCAMWLNGRGRGSRYEGQYDNSPKIGNCSSKTGNGANFSSAFKTQLKQLFDTQRDVYETGSGWIYWTWKTESASEWSYQDGLKYGWITNNLDSEGSVEC